MTHGELEPAYIAILRADLARRRQKSPRLSLRSFARILRIDAGTLSRVINGRQVPSYGIATRLAKNLKLTTSVESEFFCSVKEATEASKKLNVSGPWHNTTGVKIKDLDAAAYETISEWYHVAIMEMTFLDHFVPTAIAIAKRLQITEADAETAIQNLIGLNLLEFHDGKLRKRDPNLSTARKDISTSALKRNQRQFLSKAIESLEKAPIEARSMTSMTMAIDPERLPVAKKMIHDFNQTMCKFLEGGSRTRVYNLSIALNSIEIEEG